MRHEIQRAVRSGLVCAVAMAAGACLPPPGAACGDAWCSDRERCVSQGSSPDDPQLVCFTETIGRSCRMATDCAPEGFCDSGRCRVARSCAEILRQDPGARDGVYSIALDTTPDPNKPFGAYCDMTRDGGGWTLLLKASGSALGYDARAWTDASLINVTDLTTQPGDAKYQSFLSLPVTTLRGELDGFRYFQDVARMTAQQVFKGPAAIVPGFPTFNDGPHWSTQPYCQAFGVNTPFAHTRTRFGWTAGGQSDCMSNNYTAIGLGLMNDGMDQRGAGYECLGSACSLSVVDTDGQGLLWGRDSEH